MHWKNLSEDAGHCESRPPKLKTAISTWLERFYLLRGFTYLERSRILEKLNHLSHSKTIRDMRIPCWCSRVISRLGQIPGAYSTLPDIGLYANLTLTPVHDFLLERMKWDCWTQHVLLTELLCRVYQEIHPTHGIRILSHRSSNVRRNRKWIGLRFQFKWDLTSHMEFRQLKETWELIKLASSNHWFMSLVNKNKIHRMQYLTLEHNIGWMMQTKLRSLRQSVSQSLYALESAHPKLSVRRIRKTNKCSKNCIKLT